MSKKIAFVFSGGASLGSLEVGMLKALVEEGVKPDFIVGTSVGSLNGTFFASDPTIEGVEKMENIWKSIRVRDVFNLNPIKFMKNFTTFETYLISPKNLTHLISENLTVSRFEELQIPMYIQTADLKTGEEVILHTGLLKEALLASAGIPGIFPPQRMNNRVLVDGGLVNNSPISTAVKLGATKVVVFPIVSPSTPDKEPINLIQVLIRTFIYLLNRQLSADYHIYKDKVDLLIVPPPENIIVGPHDFSQSDKLIDLAYDRAKQWILNGGFAGTGEKYTGSCDVHSSVLNLMESTIPEKEKKVITRMKENVAKISHDVRETIDEKKDKIIDRLKDL